MTISNEFIMFFSAKSYWEGKTIALVLVEAIFFLFLYTLPVGVEHYTKHTQYIALGSVLPAMLNVALNYLGIKYYGYEAAAYTTMISNIALFLLHWNIASRLFKVKELFDLKWMMLLAAAVVIWGRFCRYTQNMWIIRYGGYLIVLGLALFYFKEDVYTYIRNLKRNVDE